VWGRWNFDTVCNDKVQGPDITRKVGDQLVLAESTTKPQLN
jgi:hypothetical protein